MKLDDIEKLRREKLRWYLLKGVDIGGRIMEVSEINLLDVADVTYPLVSLNALREELTYLELSGLIAIAKYPTDKWGCKMTKLGIDVVEYNTETPTGIYRPAYGTK